ncbi:MAG: hypothetical protein ACKVT2_11090 [Saprospiraceae bacterium]
MASTQSDTKPATQPSPTAKEHPPLFHLGKVKSKHTKRLKKGRGPAMDEVHQAIAKAKSAIPGSENHHPLVISYEEKPRKAGKKNKIKMFGMEIDRKKLKKNMKKRGVRAKFL